MPSHHPDHQRLHFSVLARTAVGLLLVGILALGVWLAIFWHYPAQIETPSPSALAAKRPAAQAAARLDPQAHPVEVAAPAPSASAAPPGGAYTGAEQDYGTNLTCAQHPKVEIDQELATKIGQDFPGLRQLLESDSADRDLKTVRPLLQSLLDAAKSAPVGRKPFLLLAADSVAGRLALPHINPPNSELKSQLDSLATEGLTFRWSELGGDWFYSGDLLRKVQQEYASTEEGGDAALLLLLNGWSSGPCCGNGSDQFRAVIQHGEELLASRPQSPRRTEILFVLAQAYETWWSLSQSPEKNRGEGDPAPGPYRDGAAAAREKAIAYYGEIVGSGAQSVEANCSQKPLQSLKDNQDTKQRRFYCFCD